MKFTYALLVPMFLIGCGGDKDSDTGADDTATTGGDTDTEDTDTGNPPAASIDSQSASCAGTTTTYTVGTSGDVAEVRWYAVDNANASPWGENSQLTGSGGNFTIDLEAVAAPGDVVDNSTTLYACSFIDDVVMSYVAAAYDASGAQVDCVAWGADAAGLVAETAVGVNPVDPLIDLSSCTAQ